VCYKKDFPEIVCFVYEDDNAGILELILYQILLNTIPVKENR